MTDVLQWLPVSSRVQYEILLLVARPQVRSSTKYLCHLMRKHLFAVSSYPIRFCEWPSSPSSPDKDCIWLSTHRAIAMEDSSI